MPPAQDTSVKTTNRQGDSCADDGTSTFSRQLA